MVELGESEEVKHQNVQGSCIPEPGLRTTDLHVDRFGLESNSPNSS